MAIDVAKAHEMSTLRPATEDRAWRTPTRTDSIRPLADAETSAGKIDGRAVTANRRHVIDDHRDRIAGTAFLLLTAIDGILGTHNSSSPARRAGLGVNARQDPPTTGLSPSGVALTHLIDEIESFCMLNCGSSTHGYQPGPTVVLAPP